MCIRDSYKPAAAHPGRGLHGLEGILHIGILERGILSRLAAGAAPAEMQKNIGLQNQLRKAGKPA